MKAQLINLLSTVCLHTSVNKSTSPASQMSLVRIPLKSTELFRCIYETIAEIIEHVRGLAPFQIGERVRLRVQVFGTEHAQ